MNFVQTKIQADQDIMMPAYLELKAASRMRAAKYGGSLIDAAGLSSEHGRAQVENWYPQLSKQVNGAALNPDSAFRPRVGPLDTGIIRFDGPPVEGSAQLTVFESGAVNFTGHFHDAGAPSYDVNFAVGIRSEAGILYLFRQSGHMAGTFEFGSRDFDWNIEENRNAIRDDWPNIAGNSTWWWSANVQWDILAATNAVKGLAETVGPIISIIALI